MVLTRSRRRVGALAVLALVLVLPPAPATASAADFGAEQAVIRSRGMQASIRTAVAADGVVYGFSTVSGTEPDEVRYIDGRGSRWRVVRTPYQGYVAATAVDATGNYLLYRARDGLRVTKRLANGRYTAGHLLLAKGAIPPGGSLQADLVASGGRWWAVWGFDGGQDLWEAGTFGGAFRTGRVTGSAAPDSSPTLALTTTAPQGAVLVWLRSGVLWAARSTRPGASRVMLTTRSSLAGPWRTFALWRNSYDWHDFAVTAHRGLATVFVGAHKSLQVLARSQER